MTLASAGALAHHLKHQTAMLQLMQQFDRQRERIARQEAYPVSEEDVAHCPVCHSVLPPDTEECPACARQQAPQTSTWVLLRLWRFAKPYQGQLLLGFLLTLATTAAQLVAPYLTIPLMDKILIPFQNGEKSTGIWFSSIWACCCCRRCWPGHWAGRAPSCWPRCPSA
jgi:ATP-binding cassette subfamily B protein